MNCHEVNLILDSRDFVDLGVAEKQAIEQHFEACAKCRNAWASFTEIAAEAVPAMSDDLRGRIAAMVAGEPATEARPVRRAYIVGSALVLGASAAAIALQIGNREPEIVTYSTEPEPAAASAASIDEVEPTTIEIQADDADTDAVAAPEPAEPIQTALALDPRSLAVVATPSRDADADALAVFDECHAGVLDRLRRLAGLNVIADEAVASFQTTGLTDEQIARELGAGSVLSLGMVLDCDATLSDSRTGEFIAGRAANAYVPPRPAAELDWPRFYDNVASAVGDALLIDRATLLAESQAAFLNTALSEDERMMALTRGISTREQSADDGYRNQAVVAALVQMMTGSTDLQIRRSAVLYLRGLGDATLVDPLLYTVNFDSATEVRRVAASALHEYIDEPGVKDTLRRLVDEDPDYNPAIICCEYSLGEAARRALASDEELRALSFGQLMNPDLTDYQRLQPMVDYPDRGYPGSLDAEQSNVVFTIGRDTDDPTVRSRAWLVLAGFAIPNPEFIPTLLEDLSGHADDDVRHSAARALTPYADDETVRTELEQALAEDPCDCLQSILGPELEVE